jgi:hypothetical protein
VNPFTVTENAMGFTAVRVHYTADPAKDGGTEEGAKWLEQARRLFPDENQWNQEMELSFWSAAGRRVYPEFRESLHVEPLSTRARKVVYRAWDFGWHAPACLVAQIDNRDRLCVLHEVVGHEQTTRQFAALVLDRCAAWYPQHTAGFQDFCDPAGQQRKSTAEGSEIRDVEILNTLAIYPTWQYGWSRKDGRGLVHQLLVQRADDSTGLLVDAAQCPKLVQGFLGKYVYPPRKDGQAHDEPDETNHPWADVHACLRYLTTGLYSALGLRRQSKEAMQPRSLPPYTGYGTPRRPERRET